MKKIGVPNLAIEQRKRVDRICASDLQGVTLKKTVKESRNEVLSKRKGNYMPSLDEIRNALQSLQRLN